MWKYNRSSRTSDDGEEEGRAVSLGQGSPPVLPLLNHLTEKDVFTSPLTFIPPLSLGSFPKTLTISFQSLVVIPYFFPENINIDVPRVAFSCHFFFTL